MNEKIKTLLERRASTYHELRTLVDEADEAGRDMTAEEREKFDRITADLDQMDADLRRLDDLRRRDEQFEEIRSRFNLTDDADQNASPSDEVILRDLAEGKRRVAEFRFSDEKRDITTSTASGAVPTGFMPSLWEYLTENAAIVGGGATQIRTESGEAMSVPRATAHPSATLTAEAATISESDPTLSSATLDAYKYAFLTQVSSEFLADSGVDIVAYLARQGGVALGNGFGAHVATGTGSGQPNGIVTAATVGVTGATGNSGAPQADELIDLKHSVIAPYRNRQTAAWVMSDTTLAGIRKLKDSNGQYLLVPSLQVGEPDRLLGHRIVVDTNIADAALSAKSVVFGDLSGYFARIAGGVRIERSDDYAFANDLVTFRFVMRADGNLVDTNAVKVFQGAAT